MPWRQVVVLYLVTSRLSQAYVVLDRCCPNPRGTTLYPIAIVSIFAGRCCTRVASSREDQTTWYSDGTVLRRSDSTVFGRRRPDFHRTTLYLGSVIPRRSDGIVFGWYRPYLHRMALYLGSVVSQRSSGAVLGRHRPEDLDDIILEWYISSC